MKTYKILYTTLFTLIMLFFTACGGGGGGGSMQSSSSSSANSGGMTGMFVDSPVGGLDYRCDGVDKKTDSRGYFNCQNTPVDFYIGNLKLGSIQKMTNDYLVFPQDILGQSRIAALHPEVTKMAILLQSLDSDQEPTNGIDIKQDTIEILNQVIAQGIDIQNLSLDELKQKINTIISKNTQENLHIVSTQQAQDHMLMSISKKYESPIQP